jgi:exopolysaccharide production protein ExoZ
MSSSNSAVPRVKSLDLLRLLLCLLVLLTHGRRIFDVSFPVWLTKGLFDAKSGVVLFFVLSGYALTKSLARSSISLASYKGYIIKRVFRLFPMYWASLLLTFVVLSWIKMEDLGWWGEEPVAFLTGQGFGLNQWLLHVVLLIPGMNSEFALPTVWSLMAESKISLIAFPFFGWAMLRFPFWATIGTTALFVFGSHFLYEILHTAAYLGMFSIGAVLARITEKSWSRIPTAGWVIMLLVGCGMYSCMSLRFSLPSVWMGYYLCATGSGLIIACVAHWPTLSGPMHRLYSSIGVDLSYGIYILHYPVLVAFRKLGGGFVFQHPVESGLLAMGTSVALAWILAHAVEIPMMNLGRHLAQ